MNILARELRCDEFLRFLYGTVRVIKDWRRKLIDPTHEEYASVTTDTLTYTGFRQSRETLEAFINDPAFAADFATLYPQLAHVVADARTVCLKLHQMHIARQAILDHHYRPDRKDVIKESLIPAHVHNEEERAYMMQLSVPQLRAFEAQYDKLGYMKLSASERQALVDAIDLPVLQ